MALDTRGAIRVSKEWEKPNNYQQSSANKTKMLSGESNTMHFDNG